MYMYRILDRILYVHVHVCVYVYVHVHVCVYVYVHVYSIHCRYNVPHTLSCMLHVRVHVCMYAMCIDGGDAGLWRCNMQGVLHSQLQPCHKGAKCQALHLSAVRPAGPLQPGPNTDHEP